MENNNETLTVYTQEENANLSKMKDVRMAIIENMTKEIAIDILSQDLSKRLEDYLFDDGSNVQRDFTKAIENILTEYFGH